MITYVMFAPICCSDLVRANDLTSLCVRSERALRQCAAPLSDESSYRLPARTAHTTRARELVPSCAAKATPLLALST